MLSFTDEELAGLSIPPQAMAMFLSCLLRKRYMGQYAVEAPLARAVEEEDIALFV